MDNRVIIFDKNTLKDNFNSHGYGRLRDLTSCVITEELNGRYDLELVVDSLDSKSKYLTKWAIVMAKGQLFRIHTITKDDITGTIKAIANHIFYDINFGFTIDNKADGKTVKEALQIGLPEDFKKIFEVDSDIEDIKNIYFVKNNGVESVFNIIERWGKGELVRDNFKYAINNSKGRDKGVTFTYKKIDGIEITEDTSEVITRIYPTGKDGISLKEKYITVPNWGNEEYPPFHITREVKFEDVDNEGTLRELAKQEAQKVGLSKVNFKITVQDLLNTDLYKLVPELLSVEVGDIVTIKHAKLNIRVKVKVIKKVEDIATGKVTIELGQPFKSFFESVDNGKVTVPTPDMSSYKEKLFYYSNGVAVPITNKVQSVAFIRYGVIERANLTLYFNIFLECVTPGTVDIKFKVNNNYLDFNPKLYIDRGLRNISFTYPLIAVEENVSQSMDIEMTTADGNIIIPKNSIHIMIKGQGVAGGNGGERPHAEITETLKMPTLSMGNINRNTLVKVTKLKPKGVAMLEKLALNKVSTINSEYVDSVEIQLISSGYTRPIQDFNYIYNKQTIDITSGVMRVKTMENISTSKVSAIQLSEGVLQEIALTEKTLWSSIERSEFINE